MFTKLTNKLDSFIEMGIPGYDCTVYHKGECVYRHFNGYSDTESKTPMNGNEVYNIYSCSKVITCTAALMLYEKGKFKLEDKLAMYMPEFDEMYRKTFGVDTFSVRKEKELENLEKEKLNATNDFSYATENMNVFEDAEEKTPEIPYKFLGIAFSTYIIIEIKNEMYIIDQHAAHERIMYEKVKANYYDEGERDEQFLLLPDVISLTHKEMIIAKENVEMFNRAGFSFEEFGENTIKLMSVPSMCEDMNTKQLFLDILDEIDTVAVTARQEKEDKFIATIACKAAVKAKMKLDDQEVATLMAKLLELPNPFTCPHGRPTAIKMTKTDLEKKFSRR